MNRVFVSLGSNIDPASNIEKAVFLLDTALRVTAISTIYITEPAGRPEQPSFYNCIVEIGTDADPLFLKEEVLRRIEAKLGRVRKENKFAPRTIDLDLVLYDDLIMESGELKLPDPDIMLQPYLAIPLRELAADVVVPGTNATIDRIASAMNTDTMKPLSSFTDHIRKDILHERGQ
jgi:2-amino-4-hydroxy-6-hydroxymethyldihydropteridine diphosphokinase